MIRPVTSFVACPKVLVTVERIPPWLAVLVAPGLTTEEEELEELDDGEEEAPEAIKSPMLPADLK